MEKSPKQQLETIAQILFDKKGFNILAIDVRKVSTLTDYFLFAEGNVDKHVRGLADEVIRLLKSEGETPLHVEGMELADWVVLDYLGVVVHLFTPGMRERYRLEELWREGEVVDLQLTSSEQRTEV